jgi:hypothetical protein
MRQQRSGFEKFRFVARIALVVVLGIAGTVTLIAGPLPIGAIFLFAALSFALPATPVFAKKNPPPTDDSGAAK